VIVPSVESDSAELVAARLDGGWMIQRTRRTGADLTVHTRRLMRLFLSRLRIRDVATDGAPRLAPIVFSWLAHRGVEATRLDPHDVGSVSALHARLAAVLRDRSLFQERLDQRT